VIGPAPRAGSVHGRRKLLPQERFGLGANA
jgi:hypothetical protein